MKKTKSVGRPKMEKTKLVRAYKRDAPAMKKHGRTNAEAIRCLLGKGKK